ncbi:glycosyltransferase family 1 protein [Acidithiobacillus ferrianus]|uniref:Glycosyltransferase n=2 Tax=Acidithiobacillus ferrianus TaxID=2678518 RepID=A0A845U6F5_9PROT|nr:glycosyltransferase family 1 protein [Acidithiobacillus ferrianus]NDU41105.1 glycosyltransferase [Acidithiobacillus ferrianus]
MTMALKKYLRRKMHGILYNQEAIASVRNLLRPFPGLEEEVRVLAYRLKQSTKQPIAWSQTRQISQVKPPEGYVPQLLFDVSELAIRDIHTGIQRVVRALLLEMLQHPPAGYRLHVVRADAGGSLFYAQKYAATISGQINSNMLEEPVQITPGDVFLSADLYLTFPFSTLELLRDQGLRIIFIVYDLLAMKLDAMLPKAYRLAFDDWLTGTLTITDAIICDSRSVADEVHDWLRQHPEARQSPLPIGYFHLGADLESSKPTEGTSQDEASMLAVLRERPTLLMVGTVEPRKGHAQALDALEALWKDGTDINLVIVGKEGWRSHALARRLRRHPRRNKQLFWLEKASDALLMQLYAQSTALLAASYAEGFGLPLIEAAHYGLPVIARDIPVFHEVAGDFAFYFPNTDSAALTDSLRHWLQLHAEGQAPRSADMPYLTWAQSTQQLLKVILENRWYTTYQPADARVAPDPE